MPDVLSLKAVRLEDLAGGKVHNVSISGDFGSDNIVLLPKAPLIRPVRIISTRNVSGSIIVLDEDLTIAPTIVLHGQNQTVIFGGGIPSVGHSGAVLVTAWAQGQFFFWGKGSTSNGVTINLCGESDIVLIGDDCMMANGVALMTHDMHAIIDMDSGLQTNLPQDIVLEPHVWLGTNASVMKGVTIGLGSVIGAQAVVNKSVPRFVIAGGVPAKVVKETATWDRSSIMRPETLGLVLDMAARVRQPDL